MISFSSVVTPQDGAILPPLPFPIPAGLTMQDEYEIVGGILYGITEKENLDVLNACFDDIYGFGSGVLSAFRMISSGNFKEKIVGYQMLASTMEGVGLVLADYEATSEDLVEFKDWLLFFADPITAKSTIIANIPTHLGRLTIDLGKAKVDYSNG